MCREFGLRVSVNGGRSWHNVDTSLHINGLLCVLWSKCGIVTRMMAALARLAAVLDRRTDAPTHRRTHKRRPGFPTDGLADSD